MTVGSVLFIAAGVVLLVAGAEGLVRGAASIAARFGLSSIIIGLTVVAFGTSTPELAVSVGSALRDEADIAIGNVVGSNIANVLLILGLSAVVGGALAVTQRIVRIDVPIMIGVSVLTLLVALDGEIARWEGAGLVAIFIAWLAWTVIGALRGDAPEIVAEYDEALHPEELKQRSLLLDAAFVVGGLVLLVAGSQLMVSGATDIAESLGVSDVVIGLTVVAVGTSLPELATSVLAAVRGERDIAVGNVVGSNIFNILSVLGLTALFSPSALPVADGVLNVDIPVMIAVAIACLPMFANGFELKRWEGTMFVAFYVVYTVWLILDANDHG
ncbi:MAG: calcium/sodium antiporter, partial [Ilumatobacteraceae bacterium]|nr:calcium/sodium antiporter [Ilumatobacteraceae bacterium]